MNDIFTVIRPLIDMLAEYELTWNERERIAEAIRVTMDQDKAMKKEMEHLYGENLAKGRLGRVQPVDQHNG